MPEGQKIAKQDRIVVASEPVWPAALIIILGLAFVLLVWWTG